jgi:hypothetical protein
MSNPYNCGQCEETARFRKEGVPLYKIHAAAVREANAAAIVDADNQGDDLLTWEELFLHQFNKHYTAAVQRRTQEAIDANDAACYLKWYATRCFYHEEGVVFNKQRILALQGGSGVSESKH